MRQLLACEESKLQALHTELTRKTAAFIADRVLLIGFTIQFNEIHSTTSTLTTAPSYNADIDDLQTHVSELQNSNVRAYNSKRLQNSSNTHSMHHSEETPTKETGKTIYYFYHALQYRYEKLPTTCSTANQQAVIDIGR